VLHVEHVGTLIGSVGLGLGNMPSGGMWSSVVAGCRPQITHRSDFLFFLIIYLANNVYMDRHKTLRDLLICNKKPRSFLRNGVIVGQSIFPSSMVIQDGTYPTAFHILSFTTTICV